METQILELARVLHGELGCDIRTDLTTRLLYSTDASIYQIEPLGVAFPRSVDELAALVELSAGFDVPVIARGAGSGLAGQAIGRALIVDCSRYINRLVDVDTEASVGIVEPGIVMAALNQAVGKYGLQFGPDPASAERATVGGSLANNATGAHSIRYGMAADHLLSVDVVLSDGSLATFGRVSLERARQISGLGAGLESSIYAAALRIRDEYPDAIRRNWPKTWRRASGYNLNYLLPWSPSSPPLWNGPNGLPYPPVFEGELNLAPIIAGSEGTLAIIRGAVVRLVPKTKNTVLVVLAFEGIPEACDSVPYILDIEPSAIELVPASLVNLARSIPAHAREANFIQKMRIATQEPGALLLVEFSNEKGGDITKSWLNAKLESLNPIAPLIVAESSTEQQKLWNLRKVGLGILLSSPGDLKPWSFVEDLAVPVEHLGEFVREAEYIFSQYGTHAEMYAHASAGCLHIRPVLNLKSSKGVEDLRKIASEVVALTVRLGGAVSGEHGDGIARSEWLPQMYGPEVMEAFRLLKRAADPKGLLNPGKIVQLDQENALPRMDENLRFGGEYGARAWIPALAHRKFGGLSGAIEQCNGAGVCRKDGGMMCPSFQATRDEMHSTRGRANLLRAMISGRFPTQQLADEAVYEALDLCLACKGCKSECPSGVDMAQLKYDFMHYYHLHHPRKLRDYMFGYIGTFARLASPFAPMVNGLLSARIASKLAHDMVGISNQRSLPRFVRRRLSQRIKNYRDEGSIMDGDNLTEEVILLIDAFTEYFYPEIGEAAIRVLRRASCKIHLLPVIGAGRTMISKGFLVKAKRHAKQVVNAIYAIDPDGRIPIVGIEPSEIYTLQDEYQDLLPEDDRVASFIQRTFTIEEYLIRPASSHHPPDGMLRIDKLRIAINSKTPKPNVYLHNHCYQKTLPPASDGYPNGGQATAELLKKCGYKVEVIDAGCCGMAGAFGYEAEHHEISMQVGEISLFPAIRNALSNVGSENASSVVVAASGASCRPQITDGTGRAAVHPITLIYEDNYS